MIPFIHSGRNTIKPATAFGNASNSVRKYLSFKYGWYFAFPYYFEYWDPVPGYGDTVDQAGATDVRTQFNKTTPPNWNNLASQASAANVDYVTIIAKNGRGFRFWDSQALANFSGYPYNGAIIPWYGPDYSIANSTIGYDNTFLQGAIDAFQAQNIAVCIYYEIGTDVHIRTRPTPSESTVGDATFYVRYDEYMDLVNAEIAEILNTFNGFQYLWLDSASVRYPMLDGNGNDTRYQNYLDIYNTVNNINKEISIITNIYLSIDPTGVENTNSFSHNGKLKYFPQDIIANEFVNDDALADKNEYNPEVTHDGNSYYIPKEYLYSGVYRIDESVTEQLQYPWLDNTTGYWDNQSINQIRSQSEFQTEYDYARSRGLVFNCAVPIRHNSNDIDATVLSRLQGINL